MNTIIFNDVAKTRYLCIAKMYGCETYPLHCEHAEIMMPRLSHSNQLISNDIYNSYASNVIALAEAQVNNGILNIAHSWVVANIKPYKIMTVSKNNAFYSKLELWRASDRIYMSKSTKESMIVYEYKW